MYILLSVWQMKVFMLFKRFSTRKVNLLVKFLFFLFLIFPFTLKAEWIEYDTLKNGNWSMIWNNDIIETKKSTIWIYHGSNFKEEFQESKSVITKSMITCYKNNTHTIHNLNMYFYDQQQKNLLKLIF